MARDPQQLHRLDEGALSAGPGESEKHRAAAALLLATLFWGCGFTWAKSAGEAVHRAVGLPHGSAFGPIYVLGWRFTLAAGTVFLLFGDARRGWTWGGVRRISFVGVLLAAGLVVQHLGLDRTSEAVSAFLTSLTILFVPLILTVVLRRPPAAAMWVGIVLATAGVWLMTGAAPGGFGVGEALGLACAITFSVYLLAVNAVAETEHAWRMTAGQFLVVGVVCFATAALLPTPGVQLSAVAPATVSGRNVWLNTVLLAVFPTLGSFSLLNHYQPKLDPTRAALIYLIEPIVAAAYAWAAAGRSLDAMTLAGAALILAANGLVEFLSTRNRGAPVTEPVSSPRSGPAGGSRWRCWRR
jgi:drug/metabolite transporter (DMT)-like permease